MNYIKILISFCKVSTIIIKNIEKYIQYKKFTNYLIFKL